MNDAENLRRAVESAQRSGSQSECVFSSEMVGIRTRCSEYEMANCDGTSCIRLPSEGASLYLPPFPIATPDQVARGNRPCAIPLNILVLVERPRDSYSDKVLGEWRAQAATSAVFACKRGDCIQIVRVEDGSGEHLAACRVQSARGTAGAPFECSTIYVSDTQGERIAVTAGTVISRCSARQGRVDYRVTITPPQTQPVVVQAVVRALSSAPLSYSTEVIDEYSVLGTARLRYSQVLRTREIATIRVDVHRGEGVAVSSTLYVNEQNTASEFDYHMASEAQEERLLFAVERALKNALTGICKGRWITDRTLDCSPATSAQIQK